MRATLFHGTTVLAVVLLSEVLLPSPVSADAVVDSERHRRAALTAAVPPRPGLERRHSTLRWSAPPCMTRSRRSINGSNRIALRSRELRGRRRRPPPRPRMMCWSTASLHRLRPSTRLITTTCRTTAWLPTTPEWRWASRPRPASLPCEPMTGASQPPAALYGRQRPRRMVPDDLVSPGPPPASSPMATSMVGHRHALHPDQPYAVPR